MSLKKLLLNLVAIGATLFLLLRITTVSGDVSLLFFPFAVGLIGASRLFYFPGILKSVIAVWAIGLAGALTGAVADLHAPLTHFGFLYLFTCTTIPLGLMGLDDYLTYKRGGSPERTGFLTLLEVVVTVGLALTVIQGPETYLVYFPIAVALIAISRMVDLPGKISSATAVWLIAIAGALTGATARIGAPVYQFGFGYLALCTTLPLGLMGIDDIWAYVKEKA